MTINPDLPTQEDQTNPLLSPDDPRLDAGPQDEASVRALFDGSEEKHPITMECPLCGEEIKTQYILVGSKPCQTHDGEIHEQVLIDARPMNTHEDNCGMFKLLDAILSDECTDCGGSGYATAMDGETQGTCPKCDGWGGDTPDADPDLT